MASTDRGASGANGNTASVEVHPVMTDRGVTFRRFVPDAKLVPLLLVYFTVFVDFFGVANLIPVIPFLVGASTHPEAFTSDEMGGLQAGAAMSAVLVAFNGAQFVSAVLMGPISDRLGRRPLLLCSLIAGAIFSAAQGLAIGISSFPLFIAARVFTGLFGGSRAVAIAYIADSVSPADRPKYLGFLTLSVTVAMQIGPTLGGSLALLNLALPCFATAGLSAVGSVLVWKFVGEPRHTNPKELQTAGTGGSGHSGNRAALALNSLFSFCVGFWAMAAIFGYSLLMPEKFGFDSNKVGLAALGDGLMIFAGTPIYMLMIKRFRVPVVAAVGCLMMACVGITPHLDLAPLMVVRYFSALGAPIAIPASSAIVALIAPAHKRGAWTSMTISAQALGRLVAPATLGVIFDEDYHVPFWITSAVCAFGFLCCLGLYRRVPQASSPGRASHSNTSAQSKGDAEVENKVDEGRAGVESDLDELSQHAGALVMRLRQTTDRIRFRLDSIKAGSPDPHSAVEASPERRAAAKVELSDWLTHLMETNGYTRWPEHLDNIKLMLFSSFPPIRHDSIEVLLEDLIDVYEGHIGMAQQSHLFDGAEDLMRAML